MIVLVEGPDEEQVIPVLIQRYTGGSTHVRCINMSGKSNIVRQPRGFEETIRRQHALGETRFAILVDADVTSAPYQNLEQEQTEMQRRAERLADTLEASIKVSWAIRELESWLVGGLQPGNTFCGLARVASAPANTEASPAEPKQWLKRSFGNREVAPRIKACLAEKLQLQQALQRNQSMQGFMAQFEPGPSKK